MIPKYKANLLAGHIDTAMFIATKVADYYDTALIRQKIIDADLLATVYDTEGKERQIVEQRAELSRQRLLAVGVIMAESVHKLREPAAIDGAAISWTAGVGILINGLTTVLLMRGQKGDINIRGAFLHMAADTLVSIGVVISGIVISFTGWYIIDPIIGIVIAVVILVSTWELLRDSMRLALDGVPEGIEVDEVMQAMQEAEHVTDVHHLHIWAMSTTENALTAHVVVDDEHEAAAVRKALKDVLREHGITHATIEIENGDGCCDKGC